MKNMATRNTHESTASKLLSAAGCIVFAVLIGVMLVSGI